MPGKGKRAQTTSPALSEKASTKGPRCRTCGSGIPNDSEIQKVPCTLLCEACCGGSLITKSEAIQAGCLPEDLLKLRYKTKPSNYKRGALMYLYIRSEAELLAEPRLKTKQAAAEKQEAERLRLAKSRRAAANRKGIVEAAVSPRFQEAVFGDHFSPQRKQPKTSARHVHAFFAAAVLTEEVLAPFPVARKSQAAAETVMHYLTPRAQRFESPEQVLPAMLALRSFTCDVLQKVSAAVRPFLTPGDLIAATQALPEMAAKM